MLVFRSKHVFLFFVSIALFFQSYGQLPHKLLDGREHKFCEAYNLIKDEMPREILFGLQINSDGEIFFSMNNKEWFKKIFKNNSYGVTVDLVSKDRYNCNRNSNTGIDFLLPKGTMLFPVYRADLLKGMEELSKDHMFTKIGDVPKTLLNKEIEANLVILNGNYICYYTNFLDIDRSVWHLLPMGLFTDSLILTDKTTTNGEFDFFTYSNKVQLEVPFDKAGTSFNINALKKTFDSIGIMNQNIRKVEIRAYSSIEGSEAVNKELMNRRAESIITALKFYQPDLHRIKVLTAENWVEFFNDIRETDYEDLYALSKGKIKQKLWDKAVSAGLEPLLAKHRKVVITMFLESKTKDSLITNTSILSDFKKAVSATDILKAKELQKELVNRIMDNKLPLDYIHQLEVPKTKEFSSLLNDREVYKYLLKATSEYEALDNFTQLKRLDPQNGRICYNVCALQFFMWQFGGDTLVPKTLLKDINKLSTQGISNMLYKRMIINYHILKSEEYMQIYNYAGKDSSLSIIQNTYKGLQFNDEDIYSLAKYYTNYSHKEWAEEIIVPRIGKIDVSEDLVFYYTNLLFFNPSSYSSDEFKQAALNSINLNRKRFCNFFLPNDKGGAGMQLLDNEDIKLLYCEACR